MATNVGSTWGFWHALFIICFDISLSSAWGLDTETKRMRGWRRREENTELKSFVVSLYKKYFVTFLFCCLWSRFLSLNSMCILLLQYVLFAWLKRETLLWIFMKYFRLNISIAEACYDTGGSVDPSWFFPKEQISPPLVILACFIPEKILSAWLKM